MYEAEYNSRKSDHADLLSNTPVNPAYLLRSLGEVSAAGETAATSDDDEIGTIRYANEMYQLYSGALALNNSGLVQPPLSELQIHGINQEIERLSVFTQGNEETGPTNVADRPTSAKK